MSTSIRDYVINTIISVVVTIISGYYFLSLSNKERIPTFHVEPYRRVLIHREQLKRESLPIQNDVVLVYFYFFNQGSLPIKKDNIYEPLKIKVGDLSTEILEFKIIKADREFSRITLQKDTIQQNTLNLDFTILEQNDGLVVQMTFEGDKDSDIILHGGIEEALVVKKRLAKLDDHVFVRWIYLTLAISGIALILFHKFLAPVRLFSSLTFLGAWSLLFFIAPSAREYSKENHVPKNLEVKEANPFPNGHPLPGHSNWDDFRFNIHFKEQ